MNRDKVIVKVIKKCVTDKYPMVKGVSVVVGTEKSTSPYNTHEYYYYYRIILDYTPDFYCEKVFNTVKREIYELKQFLFNQNEFILNFKYRNCLDACSRLEY
jgi:hypothetical protein